MVRSQPCGTSRKKEEVHPSVGETTPESTKVTSKVCDEAVVKIEKQINLWIHGMTANKSIMTTS